MKRIMLMLVVIVCSSFAENLILLETFHEDSTSVGLAETIVATELTFSVPAGCFVNISTGGFLWNGTIFSTCAWLEIDNDSIGNTLSETWGGGGDFHCQYDQSYWVPLETGQHKITVNTSVAGTSTGYFSRMRLQAMLFLPDSTEAVTERPPAVEPVAGMESVISKGPYVQAPGASVVVDATGRVVENVLSEDKVYISELASGTYFARDGERTVVKIVKVD